MSAAITIWRRECRSAFRSPVAWCAFAGTAAVTALLFVTALRAANGTSEHLTAVFCTQLLLSLCLPVSLFTMRLFAEERASGTLETLLTAPVSDNQVVIGKFLAAFTLVCASIVLSCLVFPVYMSIAAPPPFYSRLSLCGGFAIVFLSAAVGCAAGTLVSILSRHQAPAAAVTLVIVFISAAVFTGGVPEFSTQELTRLADLTDFARGTADTSVIFAALSMTVFLLFCAARILETRRWSASK